MLKKYTPVWVWDSYWWPASVVVQELDPTSDVIMVQFENGVTAPVKASDVRLRVPRVEEPVVMPQVSYSPPEQSNLRAGSLASPGIYVVSHFDPVHATPHEIVIEMEMTLPRCKLCSDVRFGWKCLPPQKIEENAFFNSELFDLVAHLRSAAVEVKKMAQASRQLIRHSKQFLDAWDPQAAHLH
jgi:hypothetical protein